MNRNRTVITIETIEHHIRKRDKKRVEKRRTRKIQTLTRETFHRES